MKLFSKKYLPLLMLLMAPLVFTGGIGLYPDTILGSIKQIGDSSGDPGVEKCPTIRLQATYSKKLEKTQLVDFRLDFHSSETFIGLRTKDKKVNFGISGCSSSNMCALNDLRYGMPYQLKQTGGGLIAVDGTTVMPVEPESFNSKVDEFNVKFITDSSLWKFGGKSNLGLGPKSNYLKFLTGNYAPRTHGDSGMAGNLNFYLSFEQGKSDTINQGKPPKKETKIIINPERKSFDYLSFGESQTYSIKSDAQSWLLNTRIAFDSQGQKYIKDIGSLACLDPTRYNFLTVKTQKEYEAIYSSIEKNSKKPEGEKDGLSSKTAPPIYIIHSNYFIGNDKPIGYLGYTPEKISSSIYTKKSDSVNGVFQIAVDVDSDIPDECDFLLGASYFAYREIFFQLEDTGIGSLAAKVIVQNSGEKSIDYLSCAIIITFIAFIFMCIGQCCWNCFCKPEAQRPRRGNNLRVI